MKRFFTLCLILGFLGCIFNVQAQQIPNNDFENWTGGKPVSWDCVNLNLGITSIITVTEVTTGAQNGAKAAKLESKANPLQAGSVIPGFITLGEFNVSTQEIEGGAPYTHRPTKLKGYYKYTPGGVNDKAFFGIGLSKWRGTYRDTIGQGVTLIPTATNTWTLFEVPITWTTSENPDSMNIIISASDLSTFTSVVGSTLYVDNLSFDFTPVDVVSYDNSSKSLRNYPNPFTKTTQIEFYANKTKAYEFKVVNLIGVEVYNMHIEAQKGLNIFSFNAEDLSAGVYLYTINNETKSMIIN